MKRGKPQDMLLSSPRRGEWKSARVRAKRVTTVICAPVYSEVLELRTEVVIGPEEGVPRQSSIRCDFMTLLFKERLTSFVATLSETETAGIETRLG